MKKTNPAVLAAMLAVAFMLILPATASAATSANTLNDVGAPADNPISVASVAYPHGGIWQYGTTLWGGCGDVYSNFLHNKRLHHSSVINANGQSGYSGKQEAGIWAYARTSAVCLKTDYAYYGFDD